MRQIEKNNFKQNTSELLKKFSKEISNNFSISQKLAEKYISSETIKSLDDLKNDLLSNNEKLTKINIQKLYNSILSKKEKINILAKSEINNLKKSLKNSEKSEAYELVSNEDNKIIQKIFSKKLINKAKNPQNIREHIMGASLGLFNSGISIGESMYNLGKGIIRSIPDLISILKGTGEIESFKKV